MWQRRHLSVLLLWLMYILSLTLILDACRGREISETSFLFDFIQAVDPENLVATSCNRSMPNHCTDWWTGVKCNLQNSITEIKLENMKLSGMIDADSLCKLPALRVLSLAKNLIIGGIPDSISNCTSMTHLNLSSNFLHGRVPASLINMKNLVSLDISKNYISGPIPNFNPEIEIVYQFSISEIGKGNNKSNNIVHIEENPTNATNKTDNSTKPIPKNNAMSSIEASLALLMFFAIFIFIFIAKKKSHKASKEKEHREYLWESPIKILTEKVDRDIKPGEEEQHNLIFFVEEHGRFKIEDLLGSAAELQGQSLWSSLYKVTLQNNAIFAVKRLKNLQASAKEFGHTMMQIGKLMHPNLLPLVAYHSSNEEKLLIYRYQRRRSLLYLLENYAEGKREFPWRLRLSIASGIAVGLDYIYKESNLESIPHGNLKLSNILLSETDDPLISEYGFQRFIDPKRALLYSSNGYRAPEKKVTEKSDVFSFGVILLELLTGKTVEKTGLDLPKWVKSMVREEWTGEVFDREVSKAGKQWAFPLLNVSLKCVSHSPESRPSISEVLEKVEEVVNAQDDFSFSSTSSVESNHKDGCLLHTVIPEAWETP